MQKKGSSSDKGSALQRWLNLKKDQQVSIPFPKLPQGSPAPLSLGQQRLWLLQLQHPNNPFYHYVEECRLRGEIDKEKLWAGIQFVFLRHDILRTTFRFSDGEVVQNINADPQIDMRKHDLRHLATDECESTAASIIAQETKRPFDLENGPLTRITFIQLANTDFLLVSTMHHIITDQWSMRIFREELAAYYNQPSESADLDVIPPLALQYADYANWQRQHSINQVQLDYWKKKLAGSLLYIQLPSDHTRPSKPSFKGALISREISLELTKDLKSLSVKLKSTMFVLLLTAFKVLLRRYTGQDDILVGSPFTNRDRIDLERLIGFFNDTLVLRSDLSGDPAFSDLVKQIRKTTLEGFANKNVPFEKLVQVLKPERTHSTNPLFQVMFLYHIAPDPVVLTPGIQIETRPLDLGVSKFDLTLYIAEEDDQLTAIFEYAKDLFEESTINRMLGHLINILDHIVKFPDAHILEVPILTSTEENLVLNVWNDTGHLDSEASCLHHIFEKNCKRHPNKIAVVSKSRQMTYSELNLLSDHLASELILCGSGRNIPVGLCVDRSVDMLIGILGIHKAGGAFLPLDPEYPDERLNFMLQDAQVPLIVCQEHLSDRFANEGSTVITFQSLEHVKSSKRSHPDVARYSDLAYLIYTSGSTGQPKGVSVTHDNLMHSTLARFKFYPDQPGTFLLLSSFAFDSAMAGIFWTMASGGTLILSEHRIEQDMYRLGELILQHQVTHTLLLPSLYNIILQHISPEKLQSLSTVIVAGEACSTTTCKLHFSHLPETCLYNEYGPTEATVWSTVHEITPADSRGPVPIGKPIPGVQVYILDAKLQPTPIGVPGELYIGGKGIARDYLNNPELTAQSFIPDPFDRSNGAKLYKTGDLARYRASGLIEFLGRADEQIKIRGYRVELQEIAEVMKQFTGIKEALVTFRDDPKQTTSLDKDETEKMHLAEAVRRMDPGLAEKFLRTVETMTE